MNIRDFLLDNYIYILIVILLSIITVIGFLADKKKSGKKEKPSKNTQDANQMNVANTNQAPMTYQNSNDIMLNNQPMNNSQMNTMNNQMGMMNNGLEQPMNIQNGNTTSINQMNNINQTIPQPLPPQDIPNNNGFTETMMNQQPMMNNPQPVEDINPINNQVSEPIYQPLSEQKPVIPPREPMSDIQIPKPMPSQTVPNNNFTGVMMSNQPQPMEQNIMPMQEPQSINNMAQSTMPQFSPQPIQSEPQMNFSGSQNMNQNLNNNMNMNQPNMNTGVMPTPMPTQPQNNGVPTSMPSPQPTTPQPVSFVYGPQQNNNNM